MGKNDYQSGQDSTDKMGVALVPRSDAFSAIYETGDATTEVEILASADSTESHHITDIIVSAESAMAFEIRDNNATGSPAETTVKIPKQYISANTTMPVVLNEPFKVGEGLGLNLKAYSAGNITIFIEGFTIPTV